MMTVTFYTDGACSGNHRSGRQGRMGAGIVGISDEFRREWSIPLGPGTNQMAELLAVKSALLKLKDRSRSQVTIITDSQYAIGCLTQNWKVKANAELVAELRPLIAECATFRMEKVLGHAGDPANERADKLAVAATKEGAIATSGVPEETPAPVPESTTQADGTPKARTKRRSSPPVPGARRKKTDP